MKPIYVLPFVLIFATAFAAAQPAAPPPPSAWPAPPGPPMQTYGWEAGSYLGVEIQDINAELAKQLKLPEERGVEVTAVAPDSPAAKAGLQQHDVVLEYNDQRVEGVQQFMRMVRETPSGRQVKLHISRNGSAQTVLVTAGNRMQVLGGEMSRQFGPGSQFQRDMRNLRQDLNRMQFDRPRGPMGWSNRALGIEGESVGPQLAEFFGVKHGVLVRSVAKDSPAEKAGLKAGDVITKIGGTEVSQPGDISRHIRGTGTGKSVPLDVVRNKQPLALSVQF